MSNNNTKLNFKEKVAYGLGAVGKDMVYMLSASYVLYYFQDVLGVSAIAMGIILMIARVFDAFNDPIMGVIVAKTQTRWGKFRPWLFIGTVTNALVLMLMFSAPISLDGKGLVAFAAVTYIVWGVTYTMMDIPYWSMIPAFTEGGRERENLSAMARTCAGIGSAIVTIVTVIAVNSIGSFVVSRSADNMELIVNSANNSLKAYVVEKNESGNTTGNVLEISADSEIEIIVDAQSNELKGDIYYNESNSKYTVKVNDKEFNNENSTMNFTSDAKIDSEEKSVEAEDEEARLAIYVSSEDYSGLKDASSYSIDTKISSTKAVERSGFKYFSIIVGIIFIIFILITCIGIKEKSTVNMKTPGVGEMFRALIQNDQAMSVVITIVLVNTATYITSNLLIYFFKYDLGGANWQGNYTIFNTFAGGIQIFAMMLFFPILRKFFSAIRVFTIAVVASVVGYLVLLIMAMSGVSSVYVFMIPGFLIMSAVGIMNVLVTVFLANTVDYGELKNKRRDESVIFSMQTFVVKLASGIAALAASICLSVSHISESSSDIVVVNGSIVKGLEKAIEAVKAAGEASIQGNAVGILRLTMTLTPIFGLVLALIIFKTKYILTDTKLKEISEEVRRMRDDK